MTKRIRKAVDRLDADGGTPMTEGLDLAMTELLGQRSGAERMTILLTDGQPNNVTTAEQKAGELKQHSELICFGIGHDVVVGQS